MNRVENDEEWLGQLRGIFICTPAASVASRAQTPQKVYVLLRWYLLTIEVLTGADMNVLVWDELPDGSPSFSVVEADAILSLAVIMPHP